MPEGWIAALHRFPVKGLSPEPLAEAVLAPDEYFPGDRLFAIENGPSGYDEAAPAHLPKTRFLMLQRDEALARLRTAYDARTGRLALHLGGDLACEADLHRPEGRAVVEDFLAGFLGRGDGRPPRLLRSAGRFRFTDSKMGFVSLLNLASVGAVEKAVGRPVDPLRFRANVALAGLPPWVENAWVGRHLAAGAARLEVLARTDRCAATEVDPETGARDMAVVKTLVRRFGHNVCGVYARVVEGGPIRPGDAVALLPA